MKSIHKVISFTASVALLLLCSPKLPAREAEYSRHLSNFCVNSLTQDIQGYLWLGTSHGLNRFNGAGYMTYFSGASDTDLPNDDIRDICPDSTRGGLWIGHQCGLTYFKDGIFTQTGQAVLNPVSRVLELDDETIVASGKDGLVSFNKSDLRYKDTYSAVGASWVGNICVTRSSSEIWLTLERNDSTFLCVLSKDLKPTFEDYLGRGSEATAICDDASQEVWIATGDRIHCYDIRSKSHIDTPVAIRDAVKGHRVLFINRFWDNNVLLGVQDEGLISYNLLSKSISKLAEDQRLHGQSWKCFVDKDNNIWLSDKVSKPIFYAASRPYTHINPLGDETNIQQISHLIFDRSGYIWMLVNSRMLCLNPYDHKIHWSSPALGGPSYRALYFDSGGRLWTIADDNKVLRYSISDGRATLEKSFDCSQPAFSISEDTEGKMWISSTRNFITIDLGDKINVVLGDSKLPFTFAMSEPRGRRVFTFTVHNGMYEIRPEGAIVRLSDELRNISYVTSSRDGTLWLGTYNEGLIHYNEKTGELQRIATSSGLVDSNIKSVLEDSNGNIWFSSSEHIAKYDTHSEALTIIHDDRFSEGTFYDLVSATQGPDGRLYFGGTGGITCVDPEVAVSETKDIPLYLDYIYINGSYQRTDVSSLKLDHEDNNLSFRFGGLDFNSGSLLNYSYMLQGYDKGWNYGSSDIHPVYTHIPAGDYVFRARVRTQNGEWSGNEIHLPIKIVPSPWSSNLAIFLYFIFGVAFIIGITVMLMRLKIQRERLVLADRREELNRQHLDFMTNISHEFRSPLSLIYGPVRELSEDQTLGSKEHFLVGTIERNAQRLKTLSEQFFSPSGKSTGEEVLEISENDLSLLIRSITDNYRYSALEKNIDLKLSCPESLICQYDKEKVTKIYANLLSNAVKYSLPDGHIDVKLEHREGEVWLSVSDDSIGIPEEKRESLFKRYERLGAEVSVPSAEGKGIGLNYSQRLAHLHGGSIDFRPNEPKGSIFTFHFPAKAREQASLERPENEEDTAQTREGLILITEDNEDLRGFIGSLFSQRYNVMLASDGLEASEMLKISIPDAIVSDVVMPRKTGVELCDEIKRDSDLCHIPIVLLSAKMDISSVVSSLRKGADAYIAKPFEPEQLRATVESLIYNRKLLQNRILNLTSSKVKETENTNSPECLLPQADMKFVERLHGIIDENLENEAFSVQDLASGMNISYSSLYAKVKTLTGTTPQGLISTYRMNIAMQLLSAGDATVGEVAFKVGASSPYTFSREFKKHFGFPPSKVGERS